MLEAGANPNVQDENGKTPLHYCATYDGLYYAIHTAQCLLDAGAAKEIPDWADETPLSSAFRLSRRELVEFLLKAGAVIVESSLILSSPEIQSIVAEHRKWIKSKLDEQILKEGEETIGTTKSEYLEHGEDVSRAVGKRAQKPATSTSHEYDWKNGAGFLKPPSSGGHVDGHELIERLHAARSSLQEGKDVEAVVVTENTPASANQQLHAFTSGMHSTEGTGQSVLKTIIPVESKDSVKIMSFPDTVIDPVADSQSFSVEGYHSKSNESILTEWPSGNSSILQVGKSAASNERLDSACSSDLTDRQAIENPQEIVALASIQGNTEAVELSARLDEKFTKEEGITVSSSQNTDSEILDAEAFSDVSPNSDLSMKGIGEATNSNLLQNVVSQSSATQELKGNLQDPLDKTFANAQKHGSTQEGSSILPADLVTEDDSAVVSTGPTTPTSGTARPGEVVQIASTFKMSLFLTFKRVLRLLAEFLELCEKPLEPGFQRVRWTCVCGYVLPNRYCSCLVTIQCCEEHMPSRINTVFFRSRLSNARLLFSTHLYDDFREIETGSLAQLQHALNVRPLGQSTNEMISSQAGQDGRTPVDATSSQSLVNPMSPPNTDLSSNGNSPEGLRQRRQGHTQSRDQGLTPEKTWILPIFQYEVRVSRCRLLFHELGSIIQILELGTRLSDI